MNQPIKRVSLGNASMLAARASLLAGCAMALAGFGSTVAHAQAAVAPAATPAAADTAAADAPEDTSNQIVVSGFRKSLEAALTLKRDSVAAVDAIVAEDISKFPDQNLAESLQRIPGIAISRDGGEGRQITVRGLGGQFTTVRLNGLQSQAATFNAGSGGGANRERAFDFNLFASELFKSLIVHKTAEAQLDEGSLGAVVDLNTGHPLGGKEGLHGAVSAQGYYNDLSSKLSPKLSALVNWKSPDGTLGINASVAYSKGSTLELGNNTTRWAQAAFKSVTLGGVTTPCFNAAGTYVSSVSCDQAALSFHPRIPRYGIISHDRNRLGVTGAIEWQPTDRTHIEIDGLYSRYKEVRTEKWAEVLFRTNEAGIAVINPTYDANNNMITGTFNNAFDRHENYYQVQRDTFAQINGKFDQQLTDKLKATLSGGYSKAVADVPIATTLMLDNLSATGTPNSQGYVYDYTNIRSPVLTFGTGASDPTNPANYQLTTVRDRPNSVTNKFRTAKLDFEWDVAEGFKVRAGGFYRQFDFISVSGIRDTAACTAKGATPAFGPGTSAICTSAAAGYPLSAFPAIGTDLVTLGNNGQPAGTSNSYVIANLDSGTAFSGLYSRPFGATTDIGNNRSVREKEKGFYFQVDAKGNLLGLDYSLAAGIRYIKTDVASTGNNLSATTPAVAVPTTLANSYDNWLPSLNVNLFPTRNVIVRFAIADVMTRPSLGNLSPSASIDQTNLKISYGNPGLQPAIATNYDAGVEWYFAPGSVLSVAAFSKNVSASTISTALSGQTFASSGLSTALLNPTLPGYKDAVTNGDAGNWTITRIVNSATTQNIKGLEFGLQLPFTFLPGMLRHFGGIFNATFTKSNVAYTSLQGAVTAVAPGTKSGLATAPLLTVVGPFVNASKRQFNATLYYEDTRFGVRASYSYRGPYFDSVSSGNSNIFDGYSAIKSLDASARFTVMTNLDLTVDANNLLDSYIYHFTDQNAQRNYEYYHTGRVITFGARLKF
jgi:iron complex outermembrane receptor protein